MCFHIVFIRAVSIKPSRIKLCGLFLHVKAESHDLWNVTVWSAVFRQRQSLVRDSWIVCALFFRAEFDLLIQEERYLRGREPAFTAGNL